VTYFFFQAEDGIRDGHVTGVQTCALPISSSSRGGVGPRPRGARPGAARRGRLRSLRRRRPPGRARLREARREGRRRQGTPRDAEIGRASCRERVYISGGGGFLTKNRNRRR